MELIIHDLDNEKLENLKWEIEKKEKIINKIKINSILNLFHFFILI